jgi:hypothetical protein
MESSTVTSVAEIKRAANRETVGALLRAHAI